MKEQIPEPEQQTEKPTSQPQSFLSKLNWKYVGIGLAVVVIVGVGAFWTGRYTFNNKAINQPRISIYPTYPSSPTSELNNIKCEEIKSIDECRRSNTCQPIESTGCCDYSEPAKCMTTVQVYCGCRTLSSEELKQKELCITTLGRWVGNGLCQCNPIYPSIYGEFEGARFFDKSKGCITDKTLCQNTEGQWVPGKPCSFNSPSREKDGCTGANYTNPTCKCLAGKQFYSGKGCQ